MRNYRTKKETIYEEVKSRIYDSTYEFGEKLVISRLAKEFESSEIPVREALNQLNTEGLIDFRPHVGAIVTPLSKKDVQDIFEIRIVLEVLATRLAVGNLTDGDLNHLKSIIAESQEAFQLRDYKKISKLNFKFHMHIYERSRNTLLVNTIYDLWMNSGRYPNLFEKNDEHIKVSLAEHEKIYHALLDKDADLAEKITKQHKVKAAEEIAKLT